MTVLQGLDVSREIVGVDLAHRHRRGVKARSLTLEECQRWITQLEADPNAVRGDLSDLTRWLLLATGVRIGEAHAVDWTSISGNRATVDIEYKIIRVKGHGLQRVRRTKSDAGHRTLPLPLLVTRMLDRRAAASGSAGPLFPDATLLDEGELSARQIADQLGHAKVSMTQDSYLGRRLTSRRTAETLDKTIGHTLG